MILVTLFTGLNLGSLVGITHEHEHTAEAATKKCTTCGGKGEVECSNIGVISLKGHYKEVYDVYACWTCSRSGYILTTTNGAPCYHCQVPKAEGGHGWTPSLVDCVECSGTGICSLCDGDGCGDCDGSGECTTCEGSSEVLTVCPVCEGEKFASDSSYEACPRCKGDGMVGGYVCRVCGDQSDMIKNIDHIPVKCETCKGLGYISYTPVFCLDTRGSGSAYFSSNGKTSIEGNYGSYGVKAEPATGYEFDGWCNENNRKVSTSATTSLTFDEENSYYTAVFKVAIYPVTCRHVDKDTGTKLKETSKTYQSGTEIDASDFKESISGYTFSSSSGTTIVGPNTIVYCYYKTNNPAVTPGPYTIKIDVKLQDANGNWGAVTNKVNTTVANGKSYSKSFGGGNYKSYNVNIPSVTEDYYELIAVERKTYTVTCEHRVEGTSTLLDTTQHSAICGSYASAESYKQSFTGYTFSSSTGSGQVSKDKTVVCYYKGSGPIPEMCTLTVNQTGEGSTTGAGKYEKGATAELSAVPATGWVFSKWIGRKTAGTTTVTKTSASISITMDADYTYRAMFVEDPNASPAPTDSPATVTPVVTEGPTATPKPTKVPTRKPTRTPTPIILPISKPTIPITPTPVPIKYDYYVRLSATADGSVKFNSSTAYMSFDQRRTLFEQNTDIVTALAADGYDFLGWTKTFMPGSIVSEADPEEFDFSGDGDSVYAAFAKLPEPTIATTHTDDCYTHGEKHTHDSSCYVKANVVCDYGCMPHAHDGNTKTGGDCYKTYTQNYTVCTRCDGSGRNPCSSESLSLTRVGYYKNVRRMCACKCYDCDRDVLEYLRE